MVVSETYPGGICTSQRLVESGGPSCTSMTAVQHRADSMLKEEWISQVVFNVYLVARAVNMFHG